MPRGAVRQSHVKRTERYCDKHGITTFAEYIMGRTAAKIWSCMLCNNDRTRKHGQNVRKGIVQPKARESKPTTSGKICPDCKLEMPKTGLCDECS